MELSAQQAWARLLEAARAELPDPTVRTWLDPLEPMALEEGRLILGAPDQFAVEWNESKHSGVLTRLSERVLDSRLEVAFQVHVDRTRRPQMDFFVATPPGATDQGQSRSTRPLNERYSFKTFVIGKSNELAAAAAASSFDFPMTKVLNE